VARIITKELAVKILKKLNASKVRSGKAHDDYQVEYHGVVIVATSLRRGSEKDLGHDHMPGDLHIGPGQARRLGQCPLSKQAYLQILRENGLLPDEEDEAGEVE
jgi:hypothetical protein